MFLLYVNQKKINNINLIEKIFMKYILKDIYEVIILSF